MSPCVVIPGRTGLAHRSEPPLSCGTHQRGRTHDIRRRIDMEGSKNPLGRSSLSRVGSQHLWAISKTALVLKSNYIFAPVF